MSGPTKEHVAMVEEIVAAGGTHASFAAKAGIDPRTVRRWLADERHAAFRAAYARARETRRAELLAIIHDHATGLRTEGDWKAAAWILERQFVQEFAYNIHVRQAQQNAQALARVHDELGEEVGGKVLSVFAEVASENDSRETSH